jgi:ParB family chromosome partitioning protein
LPREKRAGAKAGDRPAHPARLSFAPCENQPKERKHHMTTKKQSTSIALDRLEPWKGNVRKTGVKDGLDELMASIAAHGLLQSLVVRKSANGKFAVIAGRRRLLALKALAKSGKIAGDHPVPCRIVTNEADASEISLAENVVRVSMHPADQFEAFRTVIDNGATIAGVAARFGVSEDIVEKRLKLGRLSPAILKAYRAEVIGLEQAQAFAVSDDRAAQERVFGELSPHQLRPNLIRRALTEGEVPATDKRVQFVSVDAYREAGGILRRDLFADEEGVYLQDATLLDRLVREKLNPVAAYVRGEGWSWVEIAPDLDYADAAKFGNATPERVKLPKKEQADLKRLCRQYDLLAETVDPHADGNPETHARLSELQAQIDALEAKQERWSVQTLAIAGAIITIDYHGNVDIRRGLIRPEDARKAKAAAKAETDAAASGEAPEKPVSSGLSAALVTDLTAHRSAAIAAVLCDKPDIALAAVVHAMARELFHRAGRGGSCLQVSVKATGHHGFLANPAACKGIEALDATLERWGERLPGNPADLWQWCLAQPRETLLDLLAVCAACAVDAVIRKGERADGERIKHSDALTQALSLSMSDWYTPTADGYFSRIGKPQILDAYKQAKGADPAPAWLKLKKADLAKRVAKAIAGTGWLPEPLRTVEATSAEAFREAAE